MRLPTPCARDGKGPGHPGTLPDLIEGGLLLPTPRARDGKGADHNPRGGNLEHTLALLPTPRASDTGTSGRAAGAGFGPPLSQVVLPLVGALLPTPTAASYGSNQSPSPGAAVRPSLATLLTQQLLPTPRASDGTKGCPGQRGSSGDLTLPSAAVRVDPPAHTDADLAVGGLERWGVYAPAVGRWAVVMGRPVPEPTQLGTHGKPVLAPPLVEFLMGLPSGWVTGLDLPRTVALRVLGNGVVPQQAVVALRLLLCPGRWEPGGS
ncbi:hypothetical protein [Longispora albida]|uniref:hypothetical protein n=1 Tax=Longispora albida TaxID=203523 RepID=UPI0003734F37|nr:hypothetical protein [Longispora albida]